MRSYGTGRTAAARLENGRGEGPPLRRPLLGGLRGTLAVRLPFPSGRALRSLRASPGALRLRLPAAASRAAPAAALRAHAERVEHADEAEEVP